MFSNYNLFYSRSLVTINVGRIPWICVHADTFAFRNFFFFSRCRYHLMDVLSRVNRPTMNGCGHFSLSLPLSLWFNNRLQRNQRTSLINKYYIRRDSDFLIWLDHDRNVVFTQIYKQRKFISLIRDCDSYRISRRTIYLKIFSLLLLACLFLDW